MSGCSVELLIGLVWRDKYLVLLCQIIGQIPSCTCDEGDSSHAIHEQDWWLHSSVITGFLPRYNCVFMIVESWPWTYSNREHLICPTVMVYMQFYLTMCTYTAFVSVLNLRSLNHGPLSNYQLFMEAFCKAVASQYETEKSKVVSVWVAPIELFMCKWCKSEMMFLMIKSKLWLFWIAEWQVLWGPRVKDSWWENLKQGRWLKPEVMKYMCGFSACDILNIINLLSRQVFF